VSRSTKFGIASILFLALAIGGFWLRGPVSFLAAAIAWILGVTAALRGNKRWLVVPLAITIGFSWMLVMATSHH
jgi:hypothetical protein